MTDLHALEELYFAALEQPPADRPAFLAAACAAGADLRAGVERLLAAHPAVGGFLAGPAAPDRDMHAGAVVGGRYTLVEPVGEGGMGAVWRAEQTDPVRRAVAVKLIKAGMDSRRVLARFEAERQALALMDHPNIATVLDGGVHAGRPFFVMELVQGVPITDFCDARKLTPRQRLELFVPVCQALQHAHQKGVIHRDVKPSNVLVAVYDDRPVVKVIDFGVAKATGGALTAATLDTGPGGVVGTPQYMSPEQATLDNPDVDTRSDVYSLGVLLYELLTGSPPFPKRELDQKGLLEVLRVVREEEPPRPSARLSSADALPAVSANRGTEPKALAGLLRSDLDWVVMKALEKDRGRRYETASGFAADVLRYLSGDAVLAHPPSAGYRLRKFVRRNRGRVVAAALVLAALLAGLAGTAAGLLEAKRHERAATDRAEGERLARLDADARRQAAEANLAYARKGNDLLAAVFERLDPKANYATVGELLQSLKATLAKAVANLDAAGVSDPLAAAQMQITLGDALWSLGDWTSAAVLLEKALATQREHLGADHRDALRSLRSLGILYVNSRQFDKAVPLLEEALKRRTATLGADDPDTLKSSHDLGIAYTFVGPSDRALALLQEAHRRQAAKLGADHPDTLETLGDWAWSHVHAGQYAASVPLAEEALRLLTAKLGARHFVTVMCMMTLAHGYTNTGRHDEAVALGDECYKLMTATLGAEHPFTIGAKDGLLLCRRNAVLHGLKVGQTRATLPKLAALSAERPSEWRLYLSVAGLQAWFGLANDLAATRRRLLAFAKGTADTQLARDVAKACSLSPAADPGVREAALALVRAAAEAERGQGGNGAWTLLSLGMAEYRAGHDTAAVAALLAADERADATPGSLLHGISALYRAMSLFRQGRTDEARTLAVATAVQMKPLPADPANPLPNGSYDDLVLWLAYKEAQAVVGFTAADVLRGLRADAQEADALADRLAGFGTSLLDTKAFADAEPFLRDALTVREKADPDGWPTANARSLLGGALLGQGKHGDARPLLAAGYEGLRQREKALPPAAAARVPEALDRLIELAAATGRPDEAKAWRAERAKYPPPDALPPR